MIVTADCTFPLHRVPKNLRKKDRFLFLLPQREGYLNWCEDCERIQNSRLRHTRKFNGYTKDCWEEYSEILKRRFGGNLRRGIKMRTTTYANKHRPENHYWCGTGLHYAPIEEMVKNPARSRNGAHICKPCQSKINATSWRRYEHNDAHIKNQRKEIEHYTKRTKQARAQAKEMEAYIKELKYKKAEEESHAGIYGPDRDW